MTPITWQNGTPISTLYDDIYFSKENGLEETHHVLLAGNNLPQRWQQLAGNFHIIETGFGTGLNFFASWKLWNECKANGNLYFTSIEKHPLDISDIHTAIANWPEFSSLFNELAEQYPKTKEDISTLILSNGRVTLTLLWGDVHEMLPKITSKADAWFLDGFSPSKNPTMWTDNLYKYMRLLANKGGTFATFTAAGNVRMGLEQNGFTVEKSKGYGNKRHMLVGHWPG